MKRILSVFAVAAVVCLGMAMSTPVQARNEGLIIGGVLGGLALGAIVGSQQRGYYDRGPGYGYQPAYSGYQYDQPAYAAPRRQMCVEPREVWSNRYQAMVVRNVRVACY